MIPDDNSKNNNNDNFIWTAKNVSLQFVFLIHEQVNKNISEPHENDNKQ